MTSSLLSSPSHRFHAYFHDVYLPLLKSVTASSSSSLPQLDKLGNCLLDFFLPASSDSSSCGALKVLAVDFDLTMTNQHSGGVIELCAASCSFLSSAICPSFLHFAHLAQSRGIKICVVTFSDGKLAEAASSKQKDGARRKWIGGEELVRTAVQRCGQKSAGKLNIDRVFGYLPSQYQQRSSYQPLGLKSPMSRDKSFHLTCLYNHYALNSSAEVLYIDDDLNNCRRAAVPSSGRTHDTPTGPSVAQEDMVGALPYVLHVGGEKGFHYDTLKPV
eukprot:GHVS01065866.1.p1 GENE.GHVS01065866.1~~GHVS01065866.1.p1  ORF type:complete len:319 (-),score=63.84 GHVS01065866.1:909-1730(-)